jgi:hypothetical protein
MTSDEDEKIRRLLTEAGQRLGGLLARRATEHLSVLSTQAR